VTIRSEGGAVTNSGGRLRSFYFTAQGGTRTFEGVTLRSGGVYCGDEAGTYAFNGAVI
jgi:hypothetical protein